MQKLQQHAIEIWRAGVEAVRSDRLVRNVVQVDAASLHIGSATCDLNDVDKFAVVGGGKAGAGMVAGFEKAVSGVISPDKLTGWVNVPAGCVQATEHIHLHAARPDGVNEPTAEGAAGAQRILQIVSQLGARDVCVCLLSGGASALLPAPAEGITLVDKLEVTRFLSAAGANIEQLNTVRKQLSQIKGGGLADACHAGQLVCLIISDVMGDPLDVIGSGPTVDDSSTPQDAITILDHFDARSTIHRRVFDLLEAKSLRGSHQVACRVTNQIIGNNATAVAGAIQRAKELGYQVGSSTVDRSEGYAEEVGRALAEQAIQMKQQSTQPCCFISGGEPVVRLAEASIRGKGGRNQQLVLAALERLKGHMSGICLLSGGTDGEDGPTDAAGAFIDYEIDQQAAVAEITAALRRNNAYNFFHPLGSLIKTGPTHTNVCDLRVVVVDSDQPSV